MLGNQSYKEWKIYSKLYSCIRASYFNSLLKYFRGYWETTKNFLSNIYNNEIIPDKNFPDYSIWANIINYCMSNYSFMPFVCIHAYGYICIATNW